MNEDILLNRNNPRRTRNLVAYTGATYSDNYIEENQLEHDFCLTINDVAKILDLNITTVTTYVMPELDTARCGEYIRGYMNNPRLKVVVSKNSLRKFLGWYVAGVQDKVQCFAIPKHNSELDYEDEEADIPILDRLMYQIYSKLENKNQMQTFLSLATTYLENNHFKSYVSNDTERILNELEESRDKFFKDDVYSFNQIKKLYGFKHNEQVKRFLQRTSHIKLTLNALDKSGPAKKDNIRYIIHPTVNVITGETDSPTVAEKGMYYLALKNKTIDALTGIESDEPIYIAALMIINSEFDVIYNIFKKQKKKKES